MLVLAVLEKVKLHYKAGFEKAADLIVLLRKELLVLECKKQVWDDTYRYSRVKDLQVEGRRASLAIQPFS